MADVIVMPKLGFNQEEGELIKWHKQVGDSVKKGEVLFEVNTDKTTMSVEATGDGVLLQIMAAEGETVPVFTPIAVVGLAGENPATVCAHICEGTEGDLPTAEPASSLPASAGVREGGDLRLSPKAQRLIKERGLNKALLAGIQGTGYQGGITARDIEQSGVVQASSSRTTPLAQQVAKAHGVDISSLAGSGVDGKIVRADVEKHVWVGAVLATKTSGVVAPRILRTTPYTGVRKIIGDRLSSSMFTAPHLYFADTVDMSALLAFRKQLNETADIKVALSDLLIMAASKSLRAFPDINVTLGTGEIITYHSVNIGMAVAGKKGLIVPVVRDTQDKTLGDIAAETRGLVERAKEGALLPEEYSGGTFTISNLGMFGIKTFTAIINPPESAILAVGAIRKEPVVVVNEQGEDVVGIRPLMRIQLSVDHRVVDGLLAASFVMHLKHILEHPLAILV